MNDIPLNNEQKLVLYAFVEAISKESSPGIVHFRNICLSVPEFVHSLGVVSPKEFKDMVLEDKKAFVSQLKLILAGNNRTYGKILPSYFIFATCGNKKITIHIQGRDNVDTVVNWIKENNEIVHDIFPVSIPEELMLNKSIQHINRAVNPQLYREVLDPIMSSKIAVKMSPNAYE